MKIDPKAVRILIALSLFLTALVSGCGGNGEEASAPPEATESGPGQGSPDALAGGESAAGEEGFAALYRLARRYQAEGKAVKEIEALERALEIDPNHRLALHQLAHAYGTQLRDDDAASCFERILEIKPDDMAGLISYAGLSLSPSKGLDYDRAARLVTRAKALEPRNPEVVFMEAEIAHKRGNYRESIEIYQRCLALDPRHFRAVYGVGVAHYRLGEWEEALKYFRRALDIDPTAVIPQWNVYLTLEAMEDPPTDLPPKMRWRPAPRKIGHPDLSFTERGTEAGVSRVDGGRGGGWADVDGDRDLDLIIGGSYLPLAFYRNNGDGTFTDMARQAGVADDPSGWSAILADFDNDGDPDLFVTRDGWFGEGRNSLYRNDGNWRFVDVAEEAGVAQPDRAGFSAAAADYDNDGDLDIAVANVMPLPTATNALFRNDGDWKFTDVAEEAGVAGAGFTIGSAWGDYDNDGWIDLYTVNQGGRNGLFRNRGDGTFEDVTEGAGVDLPWLGYVTFFLDYNNDARLDIFVSTFSIYHDFVLAMEEGRALNALQRAALFRNNGDGSFTDVAKQAGIDLAFGSMGGMAGDIDNDGRIDIFLANGGPEMGRFEPNAVYWNQGDGTFLDVAPALGIDFAAKTHGVCFADYDSDGDLDVYVAVGGAQRGDCWPNLFYVNEEEGNHWLVLQPEGVRSNRDGVGMTVRLRFGGRTQYAQVEAGSGFGSTNSLQLELGLGKAALVDTLEVFWPATGFRRIYTAVPADRAYRLVEFAEALEAVEYGPPDGSGRD